MTKRHQGNIVAPQCQYHVWERPEDAGTVLLPRSVNTIFDNDEETLLLPHNVSIMSDNDQETLGQYYCSTLSISCLITTKRHYDSIIAPQCQYHVW